MFSDITYKKTDFRCVIWIKTKICPLECILGSLLGVDNRLLVYVIIVDNLH